MGDHRPDRVARVFGCGSGVAKTVFAGLPLVSGTPSCGTGDRAKFTCAEVVADGDAKPTIGDALLYRKHCGTGTKRSEPAGAVKAAATPRRGRAPAALRARREDLRSTLVLLSSGLVAVGVGAGPEHRLRGRKGDPEERERPGRTGCRFMIPRPVPGLASAEDSISGTLRAGAAAWRVRQEEQGFQVRSLVAVDGYALSFEQENREAPHHGGVPRNAGRRTIHHQVLHLA